MDCVAILGSLCRQSQMWRGRLAAGTLGGKTALEQFTQQQFGMIPLNLDIPFLDRPTAAAAALEFTGQGRQCRRIEGEAADHCHCLAAVPFALATHSHPAVTERGGGFFTLTVCWRPAAAGTKAAVF